MTLWTNKLGLSLSIPQNAILWLIQEFKPIYVVVGDIFIKEGAI